MGKRLSRPRFWKSPCTGLRPDAEEPLPLTLLPDKVLPLPENALSEAPVSDECFSTRARSFAKLAPRSSSTVFLPRMNTKVGIADTRNARATSLFSSLIGKGSGQRLSSNATPELGSLKSKRRTHTSTLRKIEPVYLRASSSKTGAIIRHGPHPKSERAAKVRGVSVDPNCLVLKPGLPMEMACAAHMML